ncbi:hypothetical protein J7K25_05870 [bacterium]|nr:hypothetical protein [bacterium]
MSSQKVKRIRILCLFSMKHFPEVRRELESLGEVDYCLYNHEALISHIPPYHILIPSLKVDVDHLVLDRADSLKIIATPTTGTDHIDLRTAARKGIEIISLKGDYKFLKNVQATAELAWLLVMALLRNFPRALQSVKEGRWESSNFRGHELYGKILGIIGYGRLGKMMSRFAHAFRMKVIAYDPYKKITDPRVKQVTKEELFATADIITIHVPLDEETRGSVGFRELYLMKKGSYLINTSRGDVIDEKALLDVLESGHLSGAALDVLSGERNSNLSNHPLINYARTHSNLLITPHIGGVTFESQSKAFLRIVYKLREKIEHLKLSNSI